MAAFTAPSNSPAKLNKEIMMNALIVLDVQKGILNKNDINISILQSLISH